MEREVIVLIAIIAVAAVVVALLVMVALFFNRLVRLRDRCDNAWRQIDVELERRYDLVPRLADIVRGYAAHEKQTLRAAAGALGRAQDAGSVGDKGPAEDSLTAAVKGLVAVGESYPDLKANLEFEKFSEELSTTENRIAGSRKYYNGTVQQYDNARQSFPGNLAARLFARSFTDREYFEMEGDEGRAAPQARL